MSNLPVMHISLNTFKFKNRLNILHNIFNNMNEKSSNCNIVKNKTFFHMFYTSYFSMKLHHCHGEDRNIFQNKENF